MSCTAICYTAVDAYFIALKTTQWAYVTLYCPALHCTTVLYVADLRISAVGTSDSDIAHHDREGN